MLRIRTKSLYGGELNEIDIPATYEQLEHWLDGESLCAAMPNLKAEHIAFLVSGMSPEEQQRRASLSPVGGELLDDVQRWFWNRRSACHVYASI